MPVFFGSSTFCQYCNSVAQQIFSISSRTVQEWNLRRVGSPKRKTALWVNVAMWPGRTAIVGPGNGVWRHWLHHHLLNNHHLAYLLGWWFVVFCNCLWLPDTVRCRLHVGFCQYAHNGLTVSMLIRPSLRGLYLLLLRCHWQTLTFV